MVCPHRQGRVEPDQTFFGQGGRGSIFRNLCGRFFFWTAPYGTLNMLLPELGGIIFSGLRNLRCAFTKQFAFSQFAL